MCVFLMASLLFKARSIDNLLNVTISIMIEPWTPTREYSSQFFRKLINAFIVRKVRIKMELARCLVRFIEQVIRYPEHRFVRRDFALFSSLIRAPYQLHSGLLIQPHSWQLFHPPTELIALLLLEVTIDSLLSDSESRNSTSTKSQSEPCGFQLDAYLWEVQVLMLINQSTVLKRFRWKDCMYW